MRSGHSVPDEHAERSQWSDQSGRREGVRCKVGRFTSSHLKKKEKKKRIDIKSGGSYESTVVKHCQMTK